MNLKMVMNWGLGVTQKEVENILQPFSSWATLFVILFKKKSPMYFLCQPSLSEKENSPQSSDIKTSGIWIHSNYQSGHSAVSYKWADLASDININWINVNTQAVSGIQIVWCCPPATLSRAEAEHSSCPGHREAVAGLSTWLLQHKLGIKGLSVCSQTHSL